MFARLDKKQGFLRNIFLRHFILSRVYIIDFRECKIDTRCVNEKATSSISLFSFLSFSVIIVFNEQLLRYT